MSLSSDHSERTEALSDAEKSGATYHRFTPLPSCAAGRADLMRLFGTQIATVMIGVPALGSPEVAAIGAFNRWSFKAGQTASEDRTNMQSIAGITLIKCRKLLRQRLAVVHVGIRKTHAKHQTIMSVDRLYDGLGLPD